TCQLLDMKLEEIREKAAGEIESLEDPESIRTPGRTWTRYPDREFGESRDIEPEIETGGEVEVLTGEEAVQEAGERFLDAVKMGENRLTAMHASRMNSVLYVRASGRSEIEIKYEEDTPVHSHLIVETEENSELVIKEEFLGEPGTVTSVDEIYAGKNSSVTYGAIESAEAELSYAVRKAVVERDGSMEWLNGMFEGDLNRTRVETTLKGDGSETEKIGVWYPTGDQHFDISLYANHVGDGTRCQMDSRAVVDDEARSVYEGLQNVGDTADDTQSFQDEKVLMLSERCEADASPKLMIENPDVEASHAASAGNVPEDEVYYMGSRGLSEETAQRLVVKGFFEPVMELIELPDLKERVRENVLEKLE
ncbi:MAG: SufD family Fe-S cluster assembly protein, partial [Candidatus Nanohaloarchaea archaeon]